MALKVLMRKKELDALKKEREELRTKQASFEAREKELEEAINEAETDEEKETVEKAIEEFEAERAEADEKEAELDAKIAEIEGDIEDLESKADATQKEEAPKEPEERKDKKDMEKRTLFHGMDTVELFEREDVKAFMSEVRSAITNKREISGEGLIVPEVFIGMIRENVMEYSKLYKHVNVRQINGRGREVVMGTIPEAVWTDCCANLNELSLSFNDAEVYCWNVGGYFAICNATLDDNDISLAEEIVSVLGQAIGYAVDKAIVYGLGTRMPMGIVTRLAQTAKPADYPATAREWVDLHTTNLLKTDATGTALFQAILTDSAVAKGKYSRGEMVWVMNETTYTYLKAQGLSINAAGVIVSGVEGTMPVAGGIVEVLDFIPDFDVVFGYMDLYLLAEREGVTVENSEHYLFTSNKTVYKGNARYDGLPVIAEGFGVVNLNNTDPTTSVAFAPDEANTDLSE